MGIFSSHIFSFSFFHFFTRKKKALEEREKKDGKYCERNAKEMGKEGKELLGSGLNVMEVPGLRDLSLLGTSVIHRRARIARVHHCRGSTGIFGL